MTLLLIKMIWSLGCVAYAVIRFPHQRRARKAPIAQRWVTLREKLLIGFSACGLFVIPLTYVLTGEPQFADYHFQPALAVVGTVVLIAAMALLHRTHRDLGRVWSISLEIRQQHAMVTHGVYGALRHPMYSAFWLWALSQAFLLPNWIAGLSGLLGFGILFFARVGREERMMLETFGDEYRAYMSLTRRIIPKIY